MQHYIVKLTLAIITLSIALGIITDGVQGEITDVSFVDVEGAKIDFISFFFLLQ